MIELNTRPEPSQVRWFGALWLPVSLVAAAVLALMRWNAPALASTLLGLALVSEAVTWIAPAFMRVILITVNVLTWPLAWLTNHLLLGLIYFGLISPIGLALRAFSRRRTQGDSYWVPRDPPANPDRYLRPY